MSETLKIVIDENLERQIAIAIGKHFHDPKAIPNTDALAVLFQDAAKTVIKVLAGNPNE